MTNLTAAIRQYRHNNSDDFVVAYDKKETEKVVFNLNAKIKDLELELGLVKISLEHKTTLLNSCEITLEREQFPQK